MGISQFEATELLPRAIGMAPRIFSGELPQTADELIRAWTFIKAMVDASPVTIHSERFWHSLGRFPLPLAMPAPGEPVDPPYLCPAFLAYLPDSFLPGDSCLTDVDGLRRIDEGFLQTLVHESRHSNSAWLEFLHNVGVSSSVKALRYSFDIDIADAQLLLDVDAPGAFGGVQFTGERQRDENMAVVDILRSSPYYLWEQTVASIVPCGHGSTPVLHRLTVLDGLAQCCEFADLEYQCEDSHWQQRLWSLVRSIPCEPIGDGEPDNARCAGGRGGHNVNIASYLRTQLSHYRWLPTSQGPASSQASFVRLLTRRLISQIAGNQELGDALLPYVVAPTIEDVSLLRQLGVAPLEDASSADPSTLLRALEQLGTCLSTDWGRVEILDARSRWRSVRGAIQEIYRVLNAANSIPQRVSDVPFAVREATGIRFLKGPLYYAQPGSPVEQALRGAIPLLDADRPYAKLFKSIGVTQLVTGDTVQERFLAAGSSVPASRLQQEIVEELAPLLLGANIVRSESAAQQQELILRRLRERFEVRAAIPLTVSFALRGDVSIERTVDFAPFYLQTRRAPETSFTLYVADSASAAVADVDADALGEALVPLFSDAQGPNDELAALFARIVSRYKYLRGDRDAMADYLYHQLHVSREAQDTARALLLEDSANTPPPMSATPPLTIVVPKGDPDIATTSQSGRPDLLSRHRDSVSDAAASLLRYATSSQGSNTPLGAMGSTVTAVVHQGDEITPEQQDRGERGELEVKRRLELPGGWDGFTLLADVRSQKCGFDFLCRLDGREVKVEVKAFTEDGRAILTSRELHEAAVSKDDYYLLGLLDDGTPPQSWRSFVHPNPLQTLLTIGEFDIQAKLLAPAKTLFSINGSSS